MIELFNNKRCLIGFILFCGAISGIHADTELYDTDTAEEQYMVDDDVRRRAL